MANREEVSEHGALGQTAAQRKSGSADHQPDGKSGEGLKQKPSARPEVRFSEAHGVDGKER
jgi:hypothetical protein